MDTHIYRDQRGVALKVGDTVAVAQRSGSACWLALGVVEELKRVPQRYREKEQEDRVVIRFTDTNRTSRDRHPSSCVKLSEDLNDAR